jgi:DNA-binding NarL/FixJ family response regulator
MTRVVIVDDHACSAPACAPSSATSVEVVGEAGTVDEAIAADPRRAPPDVVLLDVHMPDGGGVEVLRATRDLPAPRSWRCRSPTPPRT